MTAVGLLFAIGEEWKEARQMLEAAFTQQTVLNMLDASRTLIRHHLQDKMEVK